MAYPSNVLVVAPDPAVAACLVTWLSAEGHQIRLCRSFSDAKPELDGRAPDLLVTQLKLGAFNGLHLAVRVRSDQRPTRTIVLGDPDATFETEAHRHGAAYIGGPLQRDAFTATARQVLGAEQRARSAERVVA
jgi:DNA-binding response OmpR family regulator